MVNSYAPLFYSFGLIGYPLGHSLSPQIHTAALRALNLRGEYVLYPVPPLTPNPSPAGRGASCTDSSLLPMGEGQGVRENTPLALETLLAQVRTGQIHGLNVTIPHKQNVIPLLDTLTPAAQAIGAVNTIFMQDGALIGDNTDADGFWADVQQVVSGEQGANSAFRIPHSALILGAGGSARAVAYALLTRGWRVTLAARRLEQAEEICEQFSVFSNQLSVTNLAEHAPLPTPHSPLIVNTTPLGMAPHPETCPWPVGLSFPENAAVYDLVYTPRETMLVQRPRAAGLPAITGLGMLIEQAALAFERWTGVDAPRVAMKASANVIPPDMIL